MKGKSLKSYGSWESTFGAEQVATAGIGLSQVQTTESLIYWVESRPQEAGRSVVVCYSDEGGAVDLTPAPFNARTRVHEYGGGAFVAHGSTVYVSNFSDQRIYRFEPGDEPVPITRDPELEAGLRYADSILMKSGEWLICVREQHREAKDPLNEIVAVSCDGSQEAKVLATGRDFYSSPRLDPAGEKLAWLAWDHPNMPWDGSELWVAEVSSEIKLLQPKLIAGGVQESIFQPEWNQMGELIFVSDRNGWWNLYRERAGKVSPILEMDAEFGSPQWVFGMSQYKILSDGSIACIMSQDGFERLGIIPHGSAKVEILDLDFTCFSASSIDTDDRTGRLITIAGASNLAHSVVAIDLQTSEFDILRESQPEKISREDLSVPEPISFPTGQGKTSYALYYPPQNQKYKAPTEELPPLLIISHGGPTSKAHTCLQLSIQFWTNRGFAVVDVNYRGSSGYGREYREQLNGNWGVFDVEDCIFAAKYLADRGEVDDQRLTIRGGSAGGYTTLCALVFFDEMSAGASYFGVADLESLTQDTHKFESRYLDRLIGPYPEEQELYRSRSPVHFANQIHCPVILFQGTEDQVVPPAQAEIMAASMKENGIPYAHITYEGEGHGFRKAQNIQHALETELAFYGEVFGFKPADELPPVDIIGGQDT